MDEWFTLEDAIREQRWKDAARAAQALLDAWSDAKSAVLWFATDEIEGKLGRIDAAISALRSLLEHEPIDEVAVHAAKVEVRALLPPLENS